MPKKPAYRSDQELADYVLRGVPMGHVTLQERQRIAESLVAGTRTTHDQRRLDWLQERVTDTIYLDDGKIVDVRGNNVREAIDAAMARWPDALEDDEAATAEKSRA